MFGFGEINVLKNLGDWKKSEEILVRLCDKVKPLMEKRGWYVFVIQEFIPKSPHLYGLNENCETISIRMRKNNNCFLDENFILGTILHELTHMEIGPHNAEFHALLNKLHDEYDELYVNNIFSKKLVGNKCGGKLICNARRACYQAALKRNPFMGCGFKLGNGGKTDELCRIDEGYIECQKCTFHNKLKNVNCEMCMEPLF